LKEVKMKTTGYPLLLRCLLLTSLLCFPAFLSAKASPLKNFDSPRLVETGEVSGILGNPSVRLIDLRTSLTDYLKGHLPNAVYLSFENLRVPRNGIPAQVPDRISLEKMMGDYLGVSNDMWVVLYSEKSNPNATFLAWTLDFLGHKRFGVLNGGWEKWSSEKLPTTQSYPPVPLKKFFGKAKRDSLAEKKGVYEHLSAKEVVIMDARPPKQYSGEEGEEMRRGHIPGAKNFFWETALEGEEVKVWKKKEELERLMAALGISRQREIIVHCQTGREASHLYFTLKFVLGFSSVRLYRGSWVEWSADGKMPVKMGMDP
jgi:thiosulfate/3-mercaptopyruvate sulfurtransferase